MLKIKYLICVLSLPLFMACASKTSGSKSTSREYSEDLSKYRPAVASEKPEEEVSPEVSVETKPEAPATPVNDITYRLENVLDSLEQKSGERTVQGYTVQVYSGNSREAANEAKSLVYRLFPESRPETTYIQPNYKVKVGKYASRLEAQKIYAKLKTDFPGAMIIPEKINLTRY